MQHGRPKGLLHLSLSTEERFRKKSPISVAEKKGRVLKIDWAEILRFAETYFAPAGSWPPGSQRASLPDYPEVGDFHPTDKVVCSRCLTETSLRAVVEDWIDRDERGDYPTGRCDYCKAESLPVVDVDDVFRFIDRQLSFRYAPSEEEWNPLLDDTDWHSSREILGELDEPPFESEQVHEDFATAFRDRSWSKRNVMEDWLVKSLTRGWREFSHHVTYVSRHVFFDPSDETGMYHPDDIPIGQLLHRIGRVFESAELVCAVPAGHEVIRARVDKNGRKYREEADFWAPPPEKTKHSRMSPRGIPMLYGASDIETALAEVRYCSEVHTASIARFVTTESFTCLDLARFPEHLSIFNPEVGHDLDNFGFADYFIREVSKRVKDEDPLEYVPTQVVTEYVRHLFRGGTVKAIRYPSSRRAEEVPLYEGKCWTFFPGAATPNGFPLRFVDTIEFP